MRATAPPQHESADDGQRQGGRARCNGGRAGLNARHHHLAVAVPAEQAAPFGIQGRLDAPGRPIVFGTTEEFLRNFGVDSTDNLPEISPVKMEDFRAEVEEEMQIKLDV